MFRICKMFIIPYPVLTKLVHALMSISETRASCLVKFLGPPQGPGASAKGAPNTRGTSAPNTPLSRCRRRSRRDQVVCGGQESA